MVDEAASARISVSLVVPVRDEEQSIAALVRSILDQDFLPTEVILVDAGSKDRTLAVARELIAGNPRFRIVEAGPAWPGRARNCGVNAAKCEWIAFTDAGITLDRMWLGELAALAEQDSSLDVVYGNFDPQVRTLLDRCAVLTWVSPISEHEGKRLRGPAVPSSLMRKKVIEEAGGFPDFRATEDLLLMEEIQKRGYNTGWQPNAKVVWSLPPTLRKTFARFRLYSRHNVYAGRQRYWHYGVLRFYAAMAIFLLIGLVRWRWLLAVLPLGLTMRVLKSIWQRRQGLSTGFVLNPVHILGSLVLLLVLDAATFSGWLQAEVDRILKRGIFSQRDQSHRS